LSIALGAGTKLDVLHAVAGDDGEVDCSAFAAVGHISQPAVGTPRKVGRDARRQRDIAVAPPPSCMKAPPVGRDSYTVLLQPEVEGGYTVTCPALPGLVTCGETGRSVRDGRRRHPGIP
jgi:hypothetical protein